jgi:hypothetical protein
MPEALYDIDISRTNYAVIYGEDDPVEEKEVVCIEPKQSWWCNCFSSFLCWA